MKSRILKMLLPLCVAGGISVSPASATPILQIDGGGQLTGALGVEVVPGSFYDVEFLDGTFLDIFTNTATPLVAASRDGANVFSTALVDAIFVDDIAMGNLFGSHPEFIQGCSSLTMCFVVTPYMVVSPTSINFGLAVINAAWANGIGNGNFDGTTSSADFFTYARWTPAEHNYQQPVTSSVPEPGNLALLGLGLAGIGLSRRRKRT